MPVSRSNSAQCRKRGLQDRRWRLARPAPTLALPSRPSAVNCSFPPHAEESCRPGPSGRVWGATFLRIRRKVAVEACTPIGGPTRVSQQPVYRFNCAQQFMPAGAITPNSENRANQAVSGSFWGKYLSVAEHFSVQCRIRLADAALRMPKSGSRAMCRRFSSQWGVRPAICRRAGGESDKPGSVRVLWELLGRTVQSYADIPA